MQKFLHIRIRIHIAISSHYAVFFMLCITWVYMNLIYLLSIESYFFMVSQTLETHFYLFSASYYILLLLIFWLICLLIIGSGSWKSLQSTLLRVGFINHINFCKCLSDSVHSHRHITRVHTRSCPLSRMFFVTSLVHCYD